MRLTVAICTWNRARSLDRTLQSLAPSIAAVPRGVDVELLVVNNRCTDATDAVIDAHRTKTFAGILRRLWQPEPGLAHARNAAIDAAAGEYIVWTDDDVTVGRDWLTAYEAAAAEHPEATFFGGPIEPVFEGGRPEWIGRCWPRLAGAYAERRFGDAPFRLDRDRLPFGANMMVRTDEQRRHRYNAGLGRRPSNAGEPLVGGDETAMFRRQLANGAQGWWVPQARVQHLIGPDRQTLAYLRAYYEGQGLAEALDRAGTGGRRILGRPAWLVRRAIETQLRYRVRRLTAPVEQWMPAFLDAARASGALRAFEPAYRHAAGRTMLTL